MPEWAGVWRKTGQQRGLLITSYKRLGKRLQQGRNSCCRGSPYSCTVGAARVPASQAAVPPSHSTLTGAELPQAKKSLAPIRTGSLRSCLTLQPCRLWPARLLCQGREGSPGKNPQILKKQRLWLLPGASRNYSEQKEFSSLWHL